MTVLPLVPIITFLFIGTSLAKDALTSREGRSKGSGQTQSRFTVVQGKGWSVCESYAHFLNRQAAIEPLPACHLKLSPEFKEPQWEELNISENLQTIYSMEYPPSIVSTNPDKPPPPLERWRVDFEQQLKEGRSPRLRRTRLVLVEGGPAETILAYEADRNECDKTVRRMGYSTWGDGVRLWLWDERKSKIDDYHTGMTFPTAPVRLVLFHDKPQMLLTAWGSVDIPPYTRVHVGGRIAVRQVFPVKGGGDPYGNRELCQIGFNLPPTVVERMTK